MKAVFVRREDGAEVWAYRRREYRVTLEGAEVVMRGPAELRFPVWDSRNIRDALLNNEWEVEYPENYGD